MDELLQAAQKRQDAIAAFWPRTISPYLTRALLRTPITPNQTTILWGVISVLNSYAVYRAMTGDYLLVPLIPVVYTFCYVLDCSDGEIARYRQIANPIGGKLLDGVSHRATEYSLLATFGLAAYAVTGRWVAIPIALVLLAGDAMYTYVYERRLTTMRHQTGFTGHVGRRPDDVYDRGTPWRALTSRQKIRTLSGQIHYKSIYPIIALSYMPGTVLLSGLAALGVYKHWKWVRLLHRTLADLPASPEKTGSEAAAPPSARAVSALAKQ